MAVVTTGFNAATHGFRFSNRFDFSLDFQLPLVGAIDLGDIVYGLCGGMCFASLDYFHANLPPPSQATPPDEGTDLHSYLLDRQVDSMNLPRGVVKVLEWMIRSDEDVGRLTAGREFSKLRRRIERGDPTVLVLIRVGAFEDPTKNHQVVALGYEFDPSTKVLRVPVYDPNHSSASVWLTMNLANPRQGIQATQSTGEQLRGFFVTDYQPRIPN